MHRVQLWHMKVSLNVSPCFSFFPPCFFISFLFRLTIAAVYAPVQIECRAYTPCAWALYSLSFFFPPPLPPLEPCEEGGKS
ncbi:hypothetical protein J3E69DRAFT_351066, partial [Trichoderma sp. SZMC 28015]